MINLNCLMDQDIQDYFEYIVKKHDTLTDNRPISVYVNKMTNRITFKTKTGYYNKNFNA